jgi:RNA polymerase sigma-70 factor (ECF subfamily)
MLNKYNDIELLKILYDNPEELSGIFEIIYDRYAAILLTFIKTLLKKRSFAEDILQETFIVLYNNLKINKPINNMKSYLYGVSRNLSIKSNQEIKQTIDIEQINDLTTIESGNSELFELIYKALPHLDDIYREAYILREIQGLEYSEISGIISISESGVRSRVSRAVAMIREILKPIITELRKFN